ncbi:type IV secretion system protein [Photobacterium iliopiscarium]|uniref:type IV secretion system protein n=1 Tax=Photobacterium iliopiscarium TaxID=56192 RepID=UPI001F17241D|nr:type IV secretion system protein [Photobacterium iliopiscarium]MCF2245862.1 hypothetical protein [Photobacterium iliopiscarium]
MESNSIIIFQWIGQQIDLVLDQTVFTAINGFIAVFSIPIYSLITIYLFWKGYLILIGQTEQYFRDYLISALKIIVITYFSLNVTHFTTYIIDNYNALNVALISSVNGGNNTSVETIYILLDKTLITALEQISFCYEQFVFDYNFGWLLSIITIFISYLPLLIMAATLIIGVEILIKLLFVIAPICFVFAMFPSSKKVFDAWISKMLEMTFTLLLVFSTVIFMTTIFSTWMSANKFSNELNPYALSAQLIILSWILLWVLKQVNQMAASLAGGFATGVLQLSDIAQNAAASLKHVSIAAKPITAPSSWAAKSITQSLIEKYNSRGDQMANPTRSDNDKKPKRLDATSKRIDEINKQSRI